MQWSTDCTLPGRSQFGLLKQHIITSQRFHISSSQSLLSKQHDGVSQFHGVSDCYYTGRLKGLLYVRHFGNITEIACWSERRTRDRKVASSNPGRRSGRISFSRVKFV